MKLRVMLVALALCFFSSTAFAQGTSPNRLDESVFSLSFSVPGGGNPYSGGAFGLWYMVSSPLNLGVNLGFAVDSVDVGGESQTAVDFLLAPAVKYYMNTNSQVAPFLLGQFNMRIGSDGVDGSDSEVEVGLLVGFGIEWFPVRNFSIGGHTGLGFDFVRPDPQGFAMGTLHSGLSAQFYWK